MDEALIQGINAVSMEIVKAREKMLEKALIDNGYVFDEEGELEEFLRINSTIEYHPNLLRRFVVNGKCICEWWETFRLKNKEGEITLIWGEKPEQE